MLAMYMYIVKDSAAVIIPDLSTDCKDFSILKKFILDKVVQIKIAHVQCV